LSVGLLLPWQHARSFSPCRLLEQVFKPHRGIPVAAKGTCTLDYDTILLMLLPLPLSATAAAAAAAAAYSLLVSGFWQPRPVGLRHQLQRSSRVWVSRKRTRQHPALYTCEAFAARSPGSFQPNHLVVPSQITQALALLFWSPEGGSVNQTIHTPNGWCCCVGALVGGVLYMSGAGFGGQYQGSGFCHHHGGQGCMKAKSRV
jgi:hypothetical protein